MLLCTMQTVTDYTLLVLQCSAKMSSLIIKDHLFNIESVDHNLEIQLKPDSTGKSSNIQL